MVRAYLIIALVVVSVSACGKPPLCVRLDIVQRTGLPAGSEYRIGAGHLDFLDECDLPTSAPVTWSISDSSVASIDSTGTLRGLGPGKINVIARSGRAEVKAPVEIVPVVREIRITPEDTVMIAGDSAVFTGTAIGVLGETLDSVRVVVSPAGMSQPTPYLLSLHDPKRRLLRSPNRVLLRARQEGTTYVVGQVGTGRDSTRLRIVGRSN